jgi:XTP/dITP diphosphohydrolase
VTAGATARSRLLLATGNAHKADEVQQILGDSWLVVPLDPHVDETGDTFEDNALLKARALAASAGELAVADDSGIEIDALGGGPGVRSARWTFEGDWVARVLRELAGVAEGGRGCRYVCAAAAAWPPPHEREFAVRGVVEGRVAQAPRGTGGFGYDPIMIPLDGGGRTFAEMSDAEKHVLSHRGRAFRELARHVLA